MIWSSLLSWTLYSMARGRAFPGGGDYHSYGLSLVYFCYVSTSLWITFLVVCLYSKYSSTLDNKKHTFTKYTHIYASIFTTSRLMVKEYSFCCYVAAILLWVVKVKRPHHQVSIIFCLTRYDSGLSFKVFVI